MIPDTLLNLLFPSPLLTIGFGGGVLTLGYVLTQWWAVSARMRFEARRNRLELEALSRKIEILNLKAQAAPEVSWNGCRKFTVSKKVEECEDTYSYYLTPHNGKPLPRFKPGQYLTFEVKFPNEAKPQVRCYSLSDGSLTDDHYRVTIKRYTRADGQPGAVSNYFADHVKVGDILDVKAPSGKFYLDVEVERPVVLISGGIGVTPMLAMARYLTHINDTREIYFFFGCRSSVDHMFRDEVFELQKKNPNLRLHCCYSRPLENDVRGVAYNHHSRVTVDLMKEVLPSSNFEYYLCGPGPFMDSLVNGLYAWGVPKKDVKFEAFGPATVSSKPKEEVGPADGAVQTKVEIEFSRTGKKVFWDPAVANLLDFAEANGVTGIDAGCRSGSCGSCVVAIKQGQVEYVGEPGNEPEEGSCLTCICRPKSNLVIDA